MTKVFLYWGAIILASSVVAFGALWISVCLAPSDLFLKTGERPHDRHPILHAIWVAIRNLLGYAMIGIGLLFVVLPGPGMPWLLLGLALVDFPGKKRLLHRMVQMPSVQTCLNWLRRRGGQEPLLFPEESRWESQFTGESEIDGQTVADPESERHNKEHDSQPH